jgi:hypothetical protein
MVKAKDLTRLSRGVYCIPKSTRFGTIKYNEQEIIRYYTGANGNKGLLIGYALYNKYGLTTQIAKGIEIYSNVLKTNRKTIGNIQIRRIALEPHEAERNAIEALEILQHYNEIEELQPVAFRNYLKHIAQKYNETATQNVLQYIQYKKRTIAFQAEVLDYFHVKHNLWQYLSGTSTYKSPTRGGIYETA